MLMDSHLLDCNVAIFSIVRLKRMSLDNHSDV